MTKLKEVRKAIKAIKKAMKDADFSLELAFLGENIQVQNYEDTKQTREFIIGELQSSKKTINNNVAIINAAIDQSIRVMSGENIIK